MYIFSLYTIATFHLHNCVGNLYTVQQLSNDLFTNCCKMSITTLQYVEVEWEEAPDGGVKERGHDCARWQRMEEPMRGSTGGGHNGGRSGLWVISCYNLKQSMLWVKLVVTI